MGTRERKHNNSEGDALFRDAVKDVKPLAVNKSQRRVTASARKPRTAHNDAAIRRAEGDASEPVYATTEPGEALSFRRDSVSLAIMRDLKRGRIIRQDELDLHGMTSAAAQTELRAFIKHARKRGLRCVHIVHGKGLGSGNRGAVLKSLVNGVLPQWDEVLAFCSAQPAEGGTGALYVLLKTR